MRYISLLLAFLILSTSVFGQANRTQNFDAANYNFGKTGNISKDELYRLQGVTSNVQTQLNSKEALSNKATDLTSPDNTKYPTTQAVTNGLANKQDTITGAASTITSSNLSTNKVMTTDGSGKAAASSTVDTTELGYLDGATSNIQTQINTNATNISGKVSGPASATDEAVARYDATTGKLIQDSKVSIDDNGLLSTVGTAGAGIYNSGKDFISIFGDGGVTTGSNATLDVTNVGAAIGVSNSSLVSISNISPFPTVSPINRRVTLVNNTGNSITIVNDPTTGVASTGIYTGTGNDVTLGNRSSLTFLYNNTRWIIVGGTGSGSGGVSDLDVAFWQDFESAKLTDFTQTGLALDSTSAVHSKKSAQLTHNASTVQSFKQVVAIDPKFRGKTLSLKVDCKSTASTGNVTVSVYDETNSTSLLSSTQLACGSTIDSYYSSYTTASTTASVSYTISALVQSGSPVTYVDDIVSYIYKTPVYGAVTQTPDTDFFVGTSSAVGTAASNRIVTYSGTPASIGSDVTYQRDTVNGDVFLINSDGMYTMTLTHVYATAGMTSITLNQSNLTQTGTTIPQSERLASEELADGGSNNYRTITVQKSLKAQDKIRVNSDLSCNVSDFCTFRITKQGSLRQTVVNTNSKITIPTSEVRLEGATSLGTGPQSAVVRYNSVTKLKGDAFSINPDGVDTTFGTHIRMKKAGWLKVQASVYHPSVNFTGAISLNQATLTTGSPLASEVIAPFEIISTTGIGHASGSIFVNVNDTIRVVSNGTPSSFASSNLHLTFQEQDIQVSVSNTLPQYSDSDTYVSSVSSSVTTSNLSFSAISMSGDLVVDNSLGYTRFQVTKAGNFTVTAGDNVDETYVGYIHIMVDGVQKGSVKNNGGALRQNTSWSGQLNAGQYIHFQKTAGTATTVAISITKSGKPNVTGVDVTPFVNVQTQDTETIELDQIVSFGSTNSYIANFGTVSSNTNKGILTVTQNSAQGTVVTAMKPCLLDSSLYMSMANGRGGAIVRNANALTSNYNGQTLSNVLSKSITGTNAGHQPLSASIKLNAGDTLRVFGDNTLASVAGNIGDAKWMINCTATPDTIVTPVESFSTDSNALTWADSATYTVTTLPNSAKGTYITYKYAGSTFSFSQCSSVDGRATQSDADMQANGVLIYAKNWSSVSTCQQPARVSINVGKGFKGKLATIYKSSGKTTVGELDWSQLDGSAALGAYSYYDEKNGILTIDAGFNWFSTTTLHTFNFSDNTQQASGYVVINASKTPTLSGISYVSPRTAWLSHTAASGSSGGSSVASTWTTRVLNTIDDPSSLVTSFSGNQFTLPAGEYFFEGAAPCYAGNSHKARLRNITAASTAIAGQTSYANFTANGATNASISGRVVITVPTTFEVQHWVQTAQPTNGFGVSSGTGESEVFTQLKITRIK